MDYRNYFVTYPKEFIGFNCLLKWPDKWITWISIKLHTLWALRKKHDAMGGEGQAVQGSFQKRQAQRNSQGSTVHQREPFSRPAVGWMSRIQEKRGERAGGSRLWDRASTGGREPGHSTVGAPSKPLSQRPTQADLALQSLLGGQVRGGRKCMKTKWKLPAVERMRGRPEPTQRCSV